MKTLQRHRPWCRNVHVHMAVFGAQLLGSPRFAACVGSTTKLRPTSYYKYYTSFAYSLFAGRTFTINHTTMSSLRTLRPTSQSLKAQCGTARRGVATMANFKTPTINNEPNVSETCSKYDNAQINLLLQQHYPKGSLERQKLQDALAALKQRTPLDVPLAVGGKHVRKRNFKSTIPC